MTVVDFLFPRRCLGCGKSGGYFCSGCLLNLRAPKKPVCPQCFDPSLLGSTHPSCLKPLSLDGLVAVTRFEGMIRQAIKKLKYQFVTDLAGELVSLVIDMIREYQGKLFPKFDSSWALVPVPLHPRRQRWRGFNQTQLLGRLIAKRMSLGYRDDILIRRKSTKSQAETKDSKQRRANIRWAFKVKTDSGFKIYNSRIILFDDVWTTGSTIKECAQALKRKKADRVWGLTLAR